MVYFTQKRRLPEKRKIHKHTRRNLIRLNIETVNYQTRKGVQKTPLPGFSAYMGTVILKAVPIPFRHKRKEQTD